MADCTIHCQKVNGDHIVLDPPALPGEPVADLRERVATALNLSPAWIRLLVAGSELEDAALLTPSGSTSLTIMATVSPVCDVSQLDNSEQGADIVNERGDLMKFPTPKDISINMMPFIMEDKSSIPQEYQHYWPIIQQCKGKGKDYGVSPPDERVAYLTIDECMVKQGCTHRRGGIHCESPGWASKSGGGGMIRWGGCGASKARWHGTFMCSNVSNSCRIWNVTINEPGTVIGPLGDLEHLREALEKYHSFCPKAGEVHWITETTPHESLPMQADTYRQYVRVVGGELSVWYREHSTPNRLGIQPGSKTKIVDGDKFKVSMTDATPADPLVERSAKVPAPGQRGNLLQAEGHSTVRVFENPFRGSAVIAEVPNGQQVLYEHSVGNFTQIHWGDRCGWVGNKNLKALKSKNPR